jgi:hypothetical protein
VIAALVVAGGLAAITAAKTGRPTRKPAQPTESQQVPAPQVSPAELFTQLEAMGWHQALATGRVRMVGSPAPDPGNPGQVLRLVEAPAGGLGDSRVLLATDPATGQVVALPVPVTITGPVEAAAWTYTDPDHELPITYTDLARRT